MKKIIIVLVFLFPILFFYSSYASSYKFTVNPEKAYVKPGEEISISLKVSDIDVGQEGINVVETTLEYDDNIIENIEFVEKNNWKSTYNSSKGELHGKLLYTKMVTGVTKDEEIGVLKIKIKKNLQPFSTNIKLLKVTSNDGYSLMDDGDKTINLYYTEIAPKPNVHNDPKPAPEPESEPKNEPNTPEKQEIPKETPKTEETKVIEAPISNVQTGDIIGFVIALLVVFIIILIILMIYSKKNKKQKNDIDYK